MKKLDIREVAAYVEQNIGNFHSSRLKSLSHLKLKGVLLRKNPYLFKAKNVLAAPDLVRILLDAHLSSQEETMFGEFLEELAIFICGKVYRGKKSSAEGIDLEFEMKGVNYIVSIKSGPNWGNSRQIAKMRDDFRRARRILGAHTSAKNIIAVNGCCYGKEHQPDKGDYLKLCGQAFWELISGSSTLYTDIIEPLGYKAKEKNEEFLKSYAEITNKFTFEFGKEFCVGGKINWTKLVRFNSGK